MQRREFIAAAAGTAAAVVSASNAFAQAEYPDIGAIKKFPSGGAGAAMPQPAGGQPVGGQPVGGGEMEPQMHPPKYKDLEVEAAKCVSTGNDCLRHCFGMFKMNDTSMKDCADAAFQLVAACAALAAFASVNSEHTGHLAKTVAMVCRDCEKECEKFPRIIECKTCGEACKACAAECDKVAV
jgi:Cys-rich four helix bundle protein (predicted Tat secretion target)